MSAEQIADRHAEITSPLGDLTVAARDYRLVGLYYPGHRPPPAIGELGEQVDARRDPFLSEVADQLSEYFAGRLTHFDVPVYVHSTPFRTRVWEVLQNIGYEQTLTYAQVAALVGAPGAAQSVGGAVGSNPVSIVIPCHRVVGADGTLTGYAGGIWRKQFLLDLEEPSELKEGRLF